MSFAVLGQLARAEVYVEGSENIDTSYPSFIRDLTDIGGSIRIHAGGFEHVRKRA